MAKAVKGRRYRYNHGEDHGFGRHHAGAELLAEMNELDMASGTEVTVLELDADSGSPIVHWTDGPGNERLTTVDPAFFDQYFVGVR